MNPQGSNSSADSPHSGKTTRQVLLQRAAALSRRPIAPADAGGVLKVVEFRLARERYALEQAHVREVQVLKELTPLPGAPAFLRGIINLRGQILPVIDIKKFFELPEPGIADLHMVVVVQAGEVEVGILADAIEGVRAVPLSTIQASLPTLTGIRSKYLRGISSGQVVILDVLKILSDPGLVIDDRPDNARG